MFIWNKLKYKKSYLIQSLSILRQKIRLILFMSTIEEKVSIKNSINQIKSKIIYKLTTKKVFLTKNKYSKKFKIDGYAIFTNSEINKECNKVLEKLNHENSIWKDKVNDRISLAYDGDPSLFLKDQLFNIFKNGVDEFLKEIFESDYKIIFHVLVKSNNNDPKTKPSGSMLWHSDGRNGTRINLHICHTPVADSNGAMKCLSWEDSKKVHFYTIVKFTEWFKSQNKTKKIISKNYLREMKVNFMNNYINKNSINYFQPKTDKSGLIYAFRNNNIHCGGFPHFGNERIVSILNIEPSPLRSSLLEKFSHSHLKSIFNQ